MKKLFLIAMLLLFMGVAFAQTNAPWHSIQIVDERGVTVTSITSVEIYAPGTTTNAVIFSDRALSKTMTIPITEASTNTTLVDGVLSWYGPSGFDFSITDGTNIATNADHRTRTASEGTLVFPSYLTAISSTTYSDAESATWGTSGDWVQRGGNVANQLSFTPLADNSNFIIGVSGTGKNSDFNVYVGTALGLKLDAGDPSFTWDGGAVLLNDTSNFNVGINTGTSTGLTSIGNSAAGGWALDSDAGGTLNADDSIDMTTSGGSADIDIDAAAGSVIIDGGESAADAVQVVSAGGMDISLVDDFDLSLVSGSTDENMSFVLSGATASSIIWTSSGTGTDAMDFNTSAGGMDFDIAGGAAGEDFAVTTDTSITFVTTEAVANQFYIDAQGAVTGIAIQLETTEGGIHLLADHSTKGDITLDAEDDIILTTTGALTITNTDPTTISGALTVTGNTQLISVTRIDTPIEIVAATNEIEITESGTVYVLTNATEYATTLPTVATSAGVTFRIIVGAVPSGDDYTVVTDSLEDKISGSATVNGAAVEATTDDTITFTRDAAAIGDWVELTSDGVLWYVSGQGVAATAITFTGT